MHIARHEHHLYWLTSQGYGITSDRYACNFMLKAKGIPGSPRLFKGTRADRTSGRIWCWGHGARLTLESPGAISFATVWRKLLTVLSIRVPASSTRLASTETWWSSPDSFTFPCFIEPLPASACCWASLSWLGFIVLTLQHDHSVTACSLIVRADRPQAFGSCRAQAHARR